jgi:peptidoglycan-associated lipoprotein
MASWRVSFERINAAAALACAAVLAAGCVDQRIVVSIHGTSAIRDELALLREMPADLTAGRTPALSGEPALAAPSFTGEERLRDDPSPNLASALTSESAVDIQPIDVFFQFDRFAIDQTARTALAGQASRLKTDATRMIVVEGHCDERGTRDYNLLLGERRADAVKRVLRSLGVASSRIRVTSYGKERPFCREHSDACWRQNRRVHVMLSENGTGGR